MQNGMFAASLSAFLCGQAIEPVWPEVGGVVQGGALAFLAALFWIQHKNQREDRIAITQAIQSNSEALNTLRMSCAATMARHERNCER